MRRDFDPEDYALVAKLRANPPNPWKWEIYCAGKRLPIEQSATYFDTRGAAQAYRPVLVRPPVRIQAPTTWNTAGVGDGCGAAN